MFDYTYNKDADTYDLFSKETGELVETLSESDFESEYRICAECDSAIPIDDATYCEDDGYYYCPECRDELLFLCADCDEWHLQERAVTVHDGWRSTKEVCESCATEYGAYCEYCGEFHEFDDLIHTADSDRYYCRDAWNCYEDLRQCDDCGEWFEWSDSGEWDEDCDYWYCDNCMSRHVSGVSSYHSHSYDDFRCNSGEKRGQDLFMGFELETYADDRCEEHDVSDYTESQFGSYFAMERDCSIGDGIEFITQPCTLSYHLDQLPDIAAWTRYLVHHGYNSHNSAKCGFHIHLDKKYFGKKLDCATAKLLFIFERHWDNLLRFSRRTNRQVGNWCNKHQEHDGMVSRYDERTGRYKSELLVPGKRLTSIVKKTSHERYRAINLCPYNTIEIRLWRGSLNMETIEATLKFTARLAELCKKASAIELYKMSFDDLLGDDPVIRSYWERVKDRSI